LKLTPRGSIEQTGLKSRLAYVPQDSGISIRQWPTIKTKNPRHTHQKQHKQLHREATTNRQIQENNKRGSKRLDLLSTKNLSLRDPISSTLAS